HRRQPSRAVYEVPRRSLAVLARGRRSRVVLAPLKALSLRGGATLQLQATVASLVHSPGRARNKPVKTTAQGKPGVPSAPVSACARTFFLRARLAGAVGTRLSLRPLILRRRAVSGITRAQTCRERADACLTT